MVFNPPQLEVVLQSALRGLEKEIAPAKREPSAAMAGLVTQVYIVDDEPSICTAFGRLFRSVKMAPHTFASVEDFLASDFTVESACVICDVQMPGTSGLELPGLLHRAGRRLPVIFVTGQDLPGTRENARQAGAAAYFRKPVDAQALLDAIAWALCIGSRACTAPGNDQAAQGGSIES